MSDIDLATRSEIVKARDCLMLAMISKLIGSDLAALCNPKFTKIFQATGERGALAYDVLETILKYYIPGAVLVKTKSYSFIELPAAISDVVDIVSLNALRLIRQEDDLELRNATIDLIECLLSVELRNSGGVERILTEQQVGLHAFMHPAQLFRSATMGRVSGRLLSPIQSARFTGLIQGRRTARNMNSPLDRSNRRYTMHFLDLGVRGLSSEISWTYVFDMIKELRDFAVKLGKALVVLNTANKDSRLCRYLARPEVSSSILQEALQAIIESLSSSIRKGVAPATDGVDTGLVPVIEGIDYSTLLAEYEVAFTTKLAPIELVLFKRMGIDLHSVISPSRILEALSSLADDPSTLALAGGTSRLTDLEAIAPAIDKATTAFIANLPDTVRLLFGYDAPSNLVVQTGTHTHPAATGRPPSDTTIAAILPETNEEVPVAVEEEATPEPSTEAVNQVNIEDLPPGVPTPSVPVTEDLLELIAQMRREGAI